MGKKKSTGTNLALCRNRKALQRYVIHERFEAGLVLQGSEVKSLRAGQANLESAYALLEQDEVFLHHMHIAPYEQATAFGHDPKQRRKLLLHRREIEKLRGSLTQKGYALVPLQVYLKKHYAKVELGLATGRKNYDKRETIRRELDIREAREAMQKGR